jgi:hypothetical protein
MDAQELRNLQEAYMEVVMGEEKRTFPFQKVKNQINKIEQQRNQKRNQITKDEKEGLISPRRALVKRAEIGRDSGYLQYHFDKAKKERQDINVERRSTTFYGKDKQKMTKTQREQVDLYDIILTHLLDEGYAETQEQAEVIMVNMSEDWRESILSEAILEYQPFKDKRKRVKSKVKKLESQKSEDPKDLGFRNARLQKRINSMKTVLGKKNKEITSASQQKSYDSMAKGGFKHHDDPQSKYYIK